MGQTNPEMIKQVEEGLESRMTSVMSQQFENAGGVPRVAEILNVTDRATERNLLENLALEDPGLVDEIRRLMFVFEDINNLRDKDIQTVLKNVESSQWAMALKGASEDLKKKILGNMSQRASQLLARRNRIPGSGADLGRGERSAADRRHCAAAGRSGRNLHARRGPERRNGPVASPISNRAHFQNRGPTRIISAAEAVRSGSTLPRTLSALRVFPDQPIKQSP